MPPRVTAIVVNHNRGEMLRRAVESLQQQTVGLDEILIVDNGSTDDSLDLVRDLPAVRILPLGENLGSAGGFHHGVRSAMDTEATQVLILDSDVILAPDCLAQLQKSMLAAPAVGAAGPKVYHWDSRTVLQEFGGWIDWGSADLRRSHWHHDEATAGRLTTNQEVDYVPACCLLTSLEVMEAAGNFDPGWFLYWDDIDWCARVRRTGRTIVAAAGAAAQHHGGGANKRSLVPVYYGWRNRLVFFARSAPPDKRDAALRAYFDDYLLARLACESLGLPATARMMERAVEDALGNVRGRIDFSTEEIKLDPPVSVPAEIPGELVQVHHVIGSATAELAADPKRMLQDRFGKRMPAAQAFSLRQEFEQTKREQLAALLSRICPPGG